MAVYARDDATRYREIDRWDGGVGWLAHPEEGGQRASHAIRGGDGVWIVDPLWAPGVDELIASLEDDVVGVAVCSCWHTRDAERFARAYDVPIFVPTWMGRVEKRVNAPVERYDGDLGDGSIRVTRCEPFPLWSEALAFWPSDGTLYVPDALGTTATFLVGEERLGVHLARRLEPPRWLRALEPERIVVGHGEGVFEDATRALEDALAGSKRRLPRALVENGPATVRSVASAMRE